jgi:hypothetical protein
MEADTTDTDGPWYAGAIGRIPEDDSLVYRDDAMFGPQFYAASPQDAEIAAKLLNDLEKRLKDVSLLYLTG